MPQFTQDNRTIGVETSLGKDKLLLNGFVGEERISEIFSFDLSMLSESGDIKADQIVGTKIDFYVVTPDGEKRYFNGYVSRFVYAGQGDRAHRYRAQVVPWLWLLTKGADCKVHEASESQDAKQIVEELLNNLGFTDFKWELKRKPEKRDYCVQYRETHFDFVTRLLAEEGIYFYFKHEQGKHTMVMSDHVEGVYDCKDYEVRMESKLSMPELKDNIQAWDHNFEFTTGKFAHTDYDFENPKSILMAKKNSLVSWPENSKLENYDHPGSYASKGIGDTLAQLRMEAEEVAHDSVVGQSQCYSFSPGGRFEVKEHHVDAEKGTKWVLTAVRHTVNMGGSYVSGVSQDEGIYRNDFRCIPSKVVFRPPYVPKPRVHGINSAIVVGPSGEEIYTDKFGRIKVQFHWDRLGKKNDTSSFWVRVVTPWAGTKWGIVHIPRIGQEVIVDFLEGDPDRPIVTGMIYNSDNMPPYGLPDNKTQSGIKTRSSKNGGDDNYNEIRFEDKKGEECITVHAEKDFDKTVENNETVKIGYDSKEGGQSVEIYQDRDVTIEKGNDILLIKTGNQTTTIDKGNQTTEIKTGNQTTTVNKGNQTTTIKMGNQTTDVKMGAISTKAMKSIELKVGASSIKLAPAKITIKAPTIDIKADAMANVKSPMTTVKGDGMLTLKGGMTMIN